jgi:hypothetical protein
MIMFFGRPSPIGSLEGSILKLNNDAVFHDIIVAWERGKNNRANTDPANSWESLSSRLGEPRGAVKPKLLHPTAKVEHLGDERVKIVKFISEGRVWETVL